jgi:hypothetical protein
LAGTVFSLPYFTLKTRFNKSEIDATQLLGGLELLFKNA